MQVFDENVLNSSFTQPPKVSTPVDLRGAASLEAQTETTSQDLIVLGQSVASISISTGAIPKNITPHSTPAFSNHTPSSTGNEDLLVSDQIASTSVSVARTPMSISAPVVTCSLSGGVQLTWATPSYQVTSRVHRARQVRFDTGREFPVSVPEHSSDTVLSASGQGDTRNSMDLVSGSEQVNAGVWQREDSATPVHAAITSEPTISATRRVSVNREVYEIPVSSQWSDPYDFPRSAPSIPQYNPYQIPQFEQYCPFSMSTAQAYAQRQPQPQSFNPFAGSNYPQSTPAMHRTADVLPPRSEPPVADLLGLDLRRTPVQSSNPNPTFNRISDNRGSSPNNVSFQNVGPYIPAPAPSLNPYQDFDFNPVANRTKTIPVVKWPMKYAGDDRGTGLNSFLWEVNDWTKSEQVSEPELLRSFGNLLTGKAKMWFTSNKHRFTTYSELIDSLKATFRHPDLDHYLLMEIHQRRQQKTESFLEFFLEVEKKFKSLSNPVSEVEIVHAVRRNMRAEYKRALIGREFHDLFSLQMAGQEVDATNTYLLSKPQAQTSAIQATGKPPVPYNPNRKEGPSTQQFSKGFSQGRNQPTKPTPGFRSNNPASKPAFRKDQRNSKDGKQPSKARPEKNRSSDSEASDGPSSKDVSKGVETQIRTHVPLNDKFVCFNCRSQQHMTDQCTQPYKVHCQVCGFQGFPTHRCPFCSKNGQRRKDNSPSK